MSTPNGNMAMAHGLGEFLRRERELRHISLDDVAERTKISRRYLEAIEEERYDRLPGETFVRGFIRSYAQSVGLDPEDTLIIYHQARMDQEVPPRRTEGTFPARRAKTGRSLLWLLVVGMVIASGVLVGVVTFIQGPSLLGGLLAPRPGTSTTPIVSVPLVLTVSADSDTWLQVTTDAQESQDMLLSAGQSTKWIAQERFILSIGNARAIRLKLNGRDLAIPQPAQSILRHYTISRAMLP